MDISLDIAAMSSAMSSAQFVNELGAAVLSKSLDDMQSMGASMVSMLENSVTPNIWSP